MLSLVCSTSDCPPGVARGIGPTLQIGNQYTEYDFYNVPEEIHLKSRDQNLLSFSLTSTAPSRMLKTAQSHTEKLHDTSSISRTQELLL